MRSTDDERELERLERDVLAIELRWLAPGYSASVPTAVIDEERRVHAEPKAQCDELRLRIDARPPAPPSGTLPAHQAGTWATLPLAQSPKPANPAFEVAAVPRRDFSQLVEELEAISAAPVALEAAIHLHLQRLTERWRDDPEACRWIAAVHRGIGTAGPIALAQELWPAELEPPIAPLQLTPSLLTSATEVPEPVTGLSPMQARILSAVATLAPVGGAWVRRSEVLREVAANDASVTDDQVRRSLAQLGHPSLVPVPLVELQGVTGRFDPDGPEFTHVRATPVGREVNTGVPPLPMLLVNGAAGRGAWFPPFGLEAGLDAAERLALQGSFDSSFWRGRLWEVCPPGPFRGRILDLDSRATTMCRFKAVLATEVDPHTRRARVVARLPWPLTYSQARTRVEPRLGRGWLSGAMAVIDLSGADEARLGIELEHVVFARQVRIDLETRLSLAIELPVSTGLATPVGMMSVFGTAWAFVLRRFELAAARQRQAGTAASRRAANEEAVRVAVGMLDHVLEVMRSADDDAAAVDALQRCFGAREKALIKALEFPPSHSYETGFTREQAQHLVHQRKLKSRTVEAARADWARALEETRTARERVSSNEEVWDLVRAEIKELRRRFAPEGPP